MGKLIDKTCLVIAVFMFTFVLSILVVRKVVWATIIALVISLITTLFVRDRDRTRGDRHINSKNYDTYMIVKGLDYQLDTLLSLYPSAKRCDKCIIYIDNIIIPIFKFGSLSRDDVLKCYNIAKKNNAKLVYIISNNIDRASITFSTILYDVEFHFIRSRDLYNIQKGMGILPILPAKSTKTRPKLGEIVILMISRENAPRFLFTSFILLVIGILTPLRIYYLTLSGLASLLCIVSIFSRYHDVNRSKLPLVPRVKK